MSGAGPLLASRSWTMTVGCRPQTPGEIVMQLPAVGGYHRNEAVTLHSGRGCITRRHRIKDADGISRRRPQA
jgi:hypothetical protein